MQNAQRRLADHALVRELVAAGFTGPVFDVAVTEFASYAIAVLMAWMRTGQIFGKCKAKGRPVSGKRDARRKLRSSRPSSGRVERCGG